MKPSILLKTILDICFILLLLTFFSACGLFVMMILMEDHFIPIELNNQIISDLTPTALCLVIAELLIGGLLVYTVYVLRKLVRNFFKGKIFTRYQIASLNVIGQLIVVITVAQGLVDFLGNFLLEAELQLAIEMDLSFISFWFVLAIGLFFIYLSKIFEKAKLLKEENEFTI